LASIISSDSYIKFLILSLWAINTQQLALQCFNSCNGHMNALSLTFRIGILSTNDDSGMIRLHSVKMNKITPVNGYNCPILLGSKSKYSFITNALSRVLSFLNS